MKRTLLSVILASTAFSALAADTVDLKVKGVLTNSACTPTLSNGATVDFGHIPLSNLSKTAVNQLGTKNITLTITCDSAMPVGFSTMDGRTSTKQILSITNGSNKGSAITDGAWEFGLGATAATGGVNIGAYSITSSTAAGDGFTADGVAADYITKVSNSADWRSGANIQSAVASDASDVWTLSSKGTFIPVAYKVGVYPMRITAAIQGTDTLAIKDDTNLDGLATISLVYL